MSPACMQLMGLTESTIGQEDCLYLNVYTPQKFYTTPIAPFAPVVERGGSEPFLVQLPYEILRIGDVFNGTMMFSVVTQEGLLPSAEFLANETALNYLNENYLQIFPSLLDYRFTVASENMNETSFKIRKYYFGNEPISMIYNQTVIQLPQPVQPWKIPRDAGVMSPSCLQYASLYRAISGQEDCLYLNVYTPEMPTAENNISLPVNMYIHGGAFGGLSGADYGPRYLLDFDMILVTINYRLGVFGFLSTEDAVVPGNMGLKDQVAALTWIQKNIGYFGGDPEQVTISGTSAGAASVHYHFLSRMSRGLFVRGICMSGTSLMPSALEKAPLFKAITVAKSVNCTFNSTQQLASCLLRVPAHQLARTQSVFYKFYGTPIGPFGPVVERGGPAPFLEQLPYEVLRTGDVFNGTMLFSLVTQEGLFPAAEFLANETGVNYLNQNYLQVFPDLLDYGYTVTQASMNETSMQIRKYYFGNEPISMTYNQTIIQMAGDRTITDDVETTARLQAYVTSSPVFFYSFGYRGQNSLTSTTSFTNINWGVAHGDDSLYIFNATYLVSESTPSDRAMIGIMSGMWANFTINGVPSVGSDVEWIPINRNTTMMGPYNYLMIYSPTSFALSRTKTRGNPLFWNNLAINEPGSGRPMNSFL